MLKIVTGIKPLKLVTFFERFHHISFNKFPSMPKQFEKFEILFLFKDILPILQERRNKRIKRE